MVVPYADLSEQLYEMNVSITYVLKIHQMQEYCIYWLQKEW